MAGAVLRPYAAGTSPEALALGAILVGDWAQRFQLLERITKVARNTTLRFGWAEHFATLITNGE